jgi:hypothetical protein
MRALQSTGVSPKEIPTGQIWDNLGNKISNSNELQSNEQDRNP